MLTKLRKQTQGFTIIEVLIVLAIAGLILLIVFLAVPALQRNSRNTQRRDDVARVAGAVQEVLNNNNNDVSSIQGAQGNTNIRAGLGNLAFYQSADVSAGGNAPTAVTNGTNENTVVVYTRAVCAAFSTGGGQGATSTGANARNVAIVYMTEPAGNPSRNCTSS